MAKQDKFKVPEESYPDFFDYPKPDSHIPEFLSFEDDLLRYAYNGAEVDKVKLRAWGSVYAYRSD